MTSELSNMEALLNIGANLGEIVGIGAGIRLFVGSGIMLFRKFGRAKQWALTGFLVFLTALAVPAIANLMVSVNVLLGLLITWSITSALIVFAWNAWWLPSTIATKADGKSHPIMFFFCLISGYLAPAWLVVLWMATGNKTEESFEASNAVPPVLAKIYARITNRTGKQTLGCGQVHLATLEDEQR